MPHRRRRASPVTPASSVSSLEPIDDIYPHESVSQPHSLRASLNSQTFSNNNLNDPLPVWGNPVLTLGTPPDGSHIPGGTVHLSIEQDIRPNTSPASSPIDRPNLEHSARQLVHPQINLVAVVPGEEVWPSSASTFLSSETETDTETEAVVAAAAAAASGRRNPRQSLRPSSANWPQSTTLRDMFRRQMSLGQQQQYESSDISRSGRFDRRMEELTAREQDRRPSRIDVSKDDRG